MSLHAIDAVIPEDFEAWPKESLTHAGRHTTTARKNGVTFVISQQADGWCRVTKIHGGKIVAEFVAKRLPSRVLSALGGKWDGQREAARPR